MPTAIQSCTRRDPRNPHGFCPACTVQAFTWQGECLYCQATECFECEAVGHHAHVERADGELSYVACRGCK